MKVIQTAEFANDLVKESIGEENLLTEDLSNVTDFGDSIENVMGVENFYHKISDKIGRTIIAAREYEPITKGRLLDKLNNQARSNYS